MVQFADGSTIAQCSPPDMRLPIALGLGVARPGARRRPRRCACDRPASWTFEPLDDEAFPAVRLARRVGALGGTYPAVYNASNEECVERLPRRPDRVPRHRRHRRARGRATAPRGRGAGGARPGRSARRGRLGPATGPGAAVDAGATPCSPCRGGNGLMYLLGVLAVVLGVIVVDRPARDRAPGPGQALRRQVHPVHGRLRPDGVVAPGGRDRVRVQGHPARRLRPHDRDVPAEARRVAAPRRRAAGRLMAEQARQDAQREITPEDADRLFYQRSGAEAARHHARRPGDEPDRRRRPARDRRVRLRRPDDRAGGVSRSASASPPAEATAPAALHRRRPPSPGRRRGPAGRRRDRPVRAAARSADWAQVQQRDPGEHRVRPSQVVVRRDGARGPADRDPGR